MKFIESLEPEKLIKLYNLASINDRYDLFIKLEDEMDIRGIQYISQEQIISTQSGDVYYYL